MAACREDGFAPHFNTEALRNCFIRLVCREKNHDWRTSTLVSGANRRLAVLSMALHSSVHHHSIHRMEPLSSQVGTHAGWVLMPGGYSCQKTQSRACRTRPCRQVHCLAVEQHQQRERNQLMYCMQGQRAGPPHSSALGDPTQMRSTRGALKAQPVATCASLGPVLAGDRISASPKEALSMLEPSSRS